MNLENGAVKIGAIDMTETSRPPHSEGLVRFGVFEFDPATGDLWKSD